jgi:hypothetical protein
MTAAEFQTAATEINGRDSISETLLFQLGNLGKGLIDQRLLYCPLELNVITELEFMAKLSAEQAK